MTETPQQAPPQGPHQPPPSAGWNTEHLKDYRALRRSREDRKVAGVAGGLARHLDIDPKTLRKHFRPDIDRGALEANAKVAQSLFQMATQGGNVAAAIFWMKVRGGWSEKPRPGPAGAEDAPKRFTIVLGSPRERDTEPDGE